MMMPYIIMAIEDEDDREFMESLFYNYQRLMYSEISKILGNTPQVEDVLQNTLVKLIDNLQTIRALPVPKQINYIITACKHNAYNWIRSSSRRKETYVDEWFGLEGADMAQESPEDYVLRNEELDALARVWDALDERSKYLLNGRYILGMNCQEMAKELQVKPESVRMALTRARRTALEQLKKEIM